MSGRHDDGAVHMLEATLASVLVISTLVAVNSFPVRLSGESGDELGMVAADILNVVIYGDSSIEHPGVGFSLSSPAQWENSSPALGADIGKMLPAGVHYYLATPYGTLGRTAVDGAVSCSRPFVAYSGFDNGTGQMLDCKLVLWRA